VSDLIKTLHERRLNAWEQAKEIAERAATENRDMTAEERQSWDGANADIDLIDQRLKDLVEGEQRAKDADAAFRAILDKPEDREAPKPEGTPDLRSFFAGKGGKSFDVRSDRPMGTAEFRTLSKLSAGAGANTVRTSFYDQLVAHMIDVSGILSAGPTVLNTSSGEQIQVPKTSSHSTAALVAEAGTIGASDPAFGQVPLDAYKYAFLLQVSNELVTDTSVDLEGYIAMQAGRAVGNAFGAHAITGTGSSQPNGLVTAATLGVTGGAGVAGAFTFDNLIDLYFSVIAPYRNSKSCGWILKDSSLATARKLKDTNGSYLWAPAATVGEPDTILSKPVYSDPNVAAVGLSAKSVVFGDISQYFVRMVDGIRFERSDDYAFNTDLVTYRCILRADGDLVDTTGAVKYFAGNAA
jgi:HK97 family phage major capsid protein